MPTATVIAVARAPVLPHLPAQAARLRTRKARPVSQVSPATQAHPVVPLIVPLTSTSLPSQ